MATGSCLLVASAGPRSYPYPSRPLLSHYLPVLYLNRFLSFASQAVFPSSRSVLESISGLPCSTSSLEDSGQMLEQALRGAGRVELVPSFLHFVDRSLRLRSSLCC
jgi:hypothetical protein